MAIKGIVELINDFYLINQGLHYSEINICHISLGSFPKLGLTNLVIGSNLK